MPFLTLNFDPSTQSKGSLRLKLSDHPSLLLTSTLASTLMRLPTLTEGNIVASLRPLINAVVLAPIREISQRSGDYRATPQMRHNALQGICALWLAR